VKLRNLARDLRLVRRNREWLTAPVPLARKLGYYPALAGTYARLLSGGGRRVTYLGAPFHYDNPAAPLNLQTYPFEVGRRLLAHLSEPPRSVLDIGANLGQFARTLSYLVPGCAIDSFEPNPEIFELLERNATGTMRLFGYALGPQKGTQTFYFEPNRSAIGSFFRANAGVPGNLRENPVSVVDDATEVTGRDTYDLVKVDVEGFEYEALAGLRNVRTRYLFVEVSGGGRAKSYTDGQFYRAIADTLGDFDVRYCSGWDGHSATYDLLVAFR
jgi:FkbM family methyltransferase